MTAVVLAQTRGGKAPPEVTALTGCRNKVRLVC